MQLGGLGLRIKWPGRSLARVCGRPQPNWGKPPGGALGPNAYRHAEYVLHTERRAILRAQPYNSELVSELRLLCAFQRANRFTIRVGIGKSVGQ